MVIVGIGIAPDTALAEAAGLETDNGIAVDARGRTSDPAIWAAGDCASFPYRGARLRLESVPNAIDMGEHVAASLMGAEAPYIPKPWFWSDQYDVKLQIAGLGTGHDRIVTRARDPALSVWYYRGDTLLAVDAMNDPRAYMVGKRLIEAGHSADPARWPIPPPTSRRCCGEDHRRGASRARARRSGQGRRGRASAPDLRPGAREPLQRAGGGV